MHRKSLLQVIGPSGRDVLPGLGGLWLAVSVQDKAGQESDTARILCVGPPTFFPLPQRGDTYQILMGWEDEGLVDQGRFTFQKPRVAGNPRQGHTIELRLRSADYVDKLKKGGRKHYDGKTYGEVMKDVAKEAGLEAQVDPELARRKLGYRLRWDQSLIDFATEISEELGATVRPIGGKLVAMKRGGGTSGSGKALEPVRVALSECDDYDVELDPRPEIGAAAAAWQDPKTGKRKLAKRKAGREGPTKILPHPYRSEEDAMAAADAEIYGTLNRSGSGRLHTWGRPRARAEAPVTLSGFGPDLDGPWRAESIEKTIDCRGGFLTTIEIAAGKEPKGKAKGRRASA